MIPAYITFVADKDRTNDANITNIADDIEMSSINGDDDDDDEYQHYDQKETTNKQTICNIMDVITNLDTDEDYDDDDTMETIIRTPEYNNESSRMMTMTIDDFGFVDSSKEEKDYCCINTNPNTNNNGSNNFVWNFNSNYNNCNNNTNINTTTNIISYECGSLFEDYDDDVMFPSDTIITVD